MTPFLGIPRAPLLLGLAGLIPFVAATVMLGETVMIRALGLQIMLQYGVVILAFMSGVLWGFSSKGWGFGFVLSVIPALLAFGAAMTGPHMRLMVLMGGFAGIVLLDIWFARRGLAPPYWLRLRLMLTLVVLICLGLGLLRLTYPMMGL